MQKTVLKLTLLIGFVLIGSNLVASDDKVKGVEKISKVKKPPIVDEAQKDKPKEDSVKGGGKSKDISNESNISLSTIKDVYQIKREGLKNPPYRCYIYHADKSKSEIGIIDDSTISFTINKSKLVVGDTIVVTNSQKMKKDKEFPKFIIEWVEVQK